MWLVVENVVLHVNEVLSPSAVNHGRGTLVKRECFKPLSMENVVGSGYT